MNRFAYLLLPALLGLTGCISSNITKLDLSLAGSDRLNPDLNDRPSPIVVRLLELSNPISFENADFFSLYQRAPEALTPDLMAQEELELRPGETRELRLALRPGSRYVGVVAAYRDLPETRWRYLIAVDERSITPVDLLLGEHGIRTASDGEVQP